MILEKLQECISLRSTAALPYAERLRDLRLRRVGKLHPDYAQSLGYLAGLYRKRTDFAMAEALRLEQLEILEKVLGRHHPEFKESRWQLRRLHESPGEPERRTWRLSDADGVKQLWMLFEERSKQAGSLLGRSSSTEEAPHPVEMALQEAVEACVAQEIVVLMHSNRHSEALPWAERARDLVMRRVGKLHSDYASALNHIAGLYHYMEDFDKSAATLKEEVEIREKVSGRTDPSVAECLQELAEVRCKMGDLACAEPLMREAMVILKKVSGRGDMDFMMSVTHLFQLYHEMGDLEGCQRLLLLSEKPGKKDGFSELFAPLMRHLPGSWLWKGPIAGMCEGTPCLCGNQA